MEKGALAYTGGADDGNHLAALDNKGQITQNVKSLRPDEVGFVEISRGEERHLDN